MYLANVTMMVIPICYCTVYHKIQCDINWSSVILIGVVYYGLKRCDKCDPRKTVLTAIGEYCLPNNQETNWLYSVYLKSKDNGPYMQPLIA